MESETSGAAFVEEIARCNPSLVVVSITPFGRTGPYRDYLAGELGIVHASGLGYETPFNQVEDPEREPPLKPFGHQALMVAGWTAAAATLAALRRRDSTGDGDRIEVSAFEAAMNLVRPNFAFASHEPDDGSNRARLVQRRVWGLPWIYRCADGYVSLAVIGDAHWRALREMMGDPEWARSELFATVRDRYQNADALRPALADWILGQEKEHLYREGQARHIPVFPLQECGDLLGNRHLRARGFFREVDEPAVGRAVYPGYPYRWSLSSPRRVRPAPAPGCDEREIFLHSARAKPPPPERSESMPLEGVRILDFGWVVAVPFATSWLAALGAEVVRVESMAHPDPARFLAIPPGSPPGVDSSPYFNNLNLSKRSITINLATPEGRDLVRRLVPRFDVVVENFTAGTLEKWQIGYRELSRLREDVILLSASPLGQTGPDARCVGWGPNTQAWAGLCALTGYRDGPPCGIGGTWPDFTSAIAIVFAILAALHRRDRTGRGQAIDLALAEVILSMLPEAFFERSVNGREPTRRGNRDLAHSPHDLFRCQGEDSWIAIAVENDREWGALCQALGAPALAEKYPTAFERRRAEDFIHARIAEWTRPQHAESLESELQRRGVRAIRVRNTEELVRDPHFLERSPLVTPAHPVTGPKAVLGFPARFAKVIHRVAPAPRMGADSVPVLGAMLGMSAAEIEGLRARKIIY